MLPLSLGVPSGQILRVKQVLETESGFATARLRSLLDRYEEWFLLVEERFEDVNRVSRTHLPCRRHVQMAMWSACRYLEPRTSRTPRSVTNTGIIKTDRSVQLALSATIIFLWRS